MFLFLFDNFVYNSLFASFSPSFSSPQLPAFLPYQIHDCLFYSYYCNIHTQVAPAELFCVVRMYMCSADCMGLENLFGAHLWKRLNLSLSRQPLIACRSHLRVWSCEIYGIHTQHYQCCDIWALQKGVQATRTPEACLPFLYTPGE